MDKDVQLHAYDLEPGPYGSWIIPEGYVTDKVVSNALGMTELDFKIIESLLIYNNFRRATSYWGKIRQVGKFPLMPKRTK